MLSFQLVWRNSFVKLIERKVIGAIVSTGANITHSLVNAADQDGQAHYLGTDKVNDEELYELHLNRIYDTYLPELAYWQAKEYFRGILLEQFQPGEQYTLTPSELFKYVGSKMTGRSFLAVAAQNNIPVFCGATSDSEFGMDLTLFKRNNNINIILNEMKDIQNFAAYVKSFGTWGTIILGEEFLGIGHNKFFRIYMYVKKLMNQITPDMNIQCECMLPPLKTVVYQAALFLRAFPGVNIRKKQKISVYGEKLPYIFRYFSQLYSNEWTDLVLNWNKHFYLFSEVFWCHKACFESRMYCNKAFETRFVLCRNYQRRIIPNHSFTISDAFF